MTTMASLLKQCRIEANNGRWLYWDAEYHWVIREQPYRSKSSRTLSTHNTLHEALEAATKEDA